MGSEEFGQKQLAICFRCGQQLVLRFRLVHRSATLYCEERWQVPPKNRIMGLAIYPRLERTTTRVRWLTIPGNARPAERLATYSVRDL